MRKLLSFIIFFALAFGGVASAYQIQKGDTLSGIAKRFNTSVDELTALNDIEDENVIYAGDFIETEGLLGATPTPTSSAPRIYVEAPDWQLFNGAAAGDTTLTLDDLEDIYGNEVSMGSSTKMYGRINPDGVTESISFTGITTNSDGTKTLTGVKSVLGQYPYTETSGLVRSHSIGSLFRLTNTAGFYNDFANKENNEIVEGTWLFNQIPTATTTAPTANNQLTTKGYVDGLTFAGAPDGSLTVKGIVELATGAQAAATAAVGSGDTTAALVLHTGISTSTRNAAGSYVVITAPTGYVNSTFGGVAFSMATLNSSALVVQNPASASITAATSSIPITSSVTSTLDRSWIPYKFGGDGSDGELNLTSGTTTIDLGGVAVVTKNYTSINISAGAALVFTNPSSTGSVVLLKSQSTTTIAGNISVTSTGGAGGAARSGSTGVGAGGTSQSIYQNVFSSGAGAAASTAGAGGSITVSSSLIFGKSSLFRRYHDIVIGAGGGSGNIENNANGGDELSGFGGRGAGALIIESNGALTFTGNIFAYGQNGGNGFTNENPGGAGGGGGGGGGYVRILYERLISNTGTINVSGGTGGNASSPNPGTEAGGGGGASATPGSAGAADVGNNNKSGGDGGTGVSIVEKNEFYY